MKWMNGFLLYYILYLTYPCHFSGVIAFSTQEILESGVQRHVLIKIMACYVGLLMSCICLFISDGDAASGEATVHWVVAGTLQYKTEQVVPEGGGGVR